MRGRTLCVILQNHDEAPINEGSDNLRLVIWNHLMWILLNYIEKWNLLEILEVELPYEWKSSALGKNRIFTKIIFQKLSAQDLGGSDSLRHFTKIMWFLKIFSITVRKTFFWGSFISKKFVKKCPRDVKSALGISGVGEG